MIFAKLMAERKETSKRASLLFPRHISLISGKFVISRVCEKEITILQQSTWILNFQSSSTLILRWNIFLSVLKKKEKKRISFHDVNRRTIYSSWNWNPSYSTLTLMKYSLETCRCSKVNNELVQRGFFS